jgi:hypothetical protein
MNGGKPGFAMDLRIVSEKWRAWRDMVAQPHGDGSYVIRTWSGAYRVDVAVRNRYLGLKLGFDLPMSLAAGIAVIRINDDESLSTARAALLIAAICGAVLISAYLGTRAMLRPAQRVAKEQWKAPAAVQSRLSNAILLTLDFVAVVLGAPLVCLFVWFLAEAPDLSSDDFWSTLQPTVILGMLFLSSLLRLLWPRARAFTILLTGPFLLMLAWIAANATARMWPGLTLVILFFGLLFLSAILRWWRGKSA